MKILFVEDNADSRLIFQTTLRYHGYQVDLATNGKEALQMAIQSPPDMIISDIMMPEMDGFAFCSEVKKNDRLKDIPFLFYTATFVDPKDEILAERLGAKRYIHKPIEFDKLLEIISTVLKECAEDKKTDQKQALHECDDLCDLYKEAIFRKLEKKVSDLNLYKEIIANSNDAIAVIDRNGTYMESNAAHQKLFGFTDDTLRTYTPAIHLGEEQFEKIISTLATDSFFRGELASKTLSGNLLSIEVSAFPIRDAKENIRLFILITRDISQRKKEEEKQRQLQEQLKQSQKMETVGQLASGIAHDFNNILNAILGYSELGIMELPADHRVSEFLQIIKGAGQRASGLIQQILAFSRKQVMEMQPVDLNLVIENINNMLTMVIRADIVLEIKLGKLQHYVQADIGQMEQILMNLTINAQDAMPRGGKITIETSEFINDNGLADNFPPGTYNCLKITDTGTGMSQATLEKLFEPFFTTKEAGRGTGLGLSTVFGIVKQHKGHIAVDSRLDYGTTFLVYFPVSRAGIDTEKAANQLSEIVGGNEVILVVEDDSMISRLIVEMLVPLGYEVLVAGTGDEALKIAGSIGRKINLLITDVILPGMNGKELADKIKLLDPNIKILQMSGYTRDVLTPLGVSDQGYGFIQKPFMAVTFLLKVRQLLDLQ